MSITVPVSLLLGSTYTGLTLGYRVYDVDGVEVAAWTDTGVVEVPSGSGYYRINGGVSVPDVGGYLGVGEEVGTEICCFAIENSSAVVDLLCEELLAGHTTTGTVGKALNQVASMALNGPVAVIQSNALVSTITIQD